VGIAVAFSAPIGGLLFAFEELANSFSQALGWQIFFACMIAARSRARAPRAGRALALFSSSHVLCCRVSKAQTHTTAGSDQQHGLPAS